jgi:hypothetical protein
MISDYLPLRKSLHIYLSGSVITRVRMYSILVLFALTITWSCKENASIQMETLYGKWDIERAVRNGKETPYLRGGYFVFEKNGSMTVNITGSDEKGPFTLDDRTLRINDEKNFLIETIHTDSMTIRFAMSPDNEFLFYLYKHADETN